MISPYVLLLAGAAQASIVILPLMFSKAVLLPVLKSTYVVTPSKLTAFGKKMEGPDAWFPAAVMKR
jgi:hypothetical protein